MLNMLAWKQGAEHVSQTISPFTTTPEHPLSGYQKCQRLSSYHALHKQIPSGITSLQSPVLL
jgi:hypothetical protein